MLFFLLLISTAFSDGYTDIDITIGPPLCTIQEVMNEGRDVHALALRCLGQRPVVVKSLTDGVRFSLDSDCENQLAQLTVNPQFTKNISIVYLCVSNYDSADFYYSAEYY